MSMPNFDVEIVETAEVAKLFHTTQPKIKAAILNGTLPIGFVATKQSDEEVDRVFIVDKRLKAWLNADDLTLRKRRRIKMRLKHSGTKNA